MKLGRTLRHAIFTAVLIGGAPLSAHASFITWEFSGLVDNVGLGGSAISIGDSLVWRVAFDDSSPSGCGTPGQGVYGRAIISSTLHIGGLSWTGGGGGIEVNAPDANCGAFGYEGVTFREFGWTGPDIGPHSLLAQIQGTLFYPGTPDGGIPTAPPPSALVAWAYQGPSAMTTVRDITPAPEPVPEPTTLALIGGGLVMLARRARQRFA
jgi:hypothetical protein